MLIVVLGLYSLRSLGQKNILDQEIRFRNTANLYTPKDYLNYLTSNYGIFFSYNANVIKDDNKVTINDYNGSIKEFIVRIFTPTPIDIQFVHPNKVILKPRILTEVKIPQISKFKVSGKVVDGLDSEAIIGALVFEKNSKTSAITNDDGYFFMVLQEGKAELDVKFFNYDNVNVVIDIESDVHLPIILNGIHSIPEVVVDGSNEINLNTSGEIIELSTKQKLFGISGELDVANTSRLQTGVQSGGEGQNGLYVRGGTIDQNLILVEGVSLYEFGHTVGLASIFVNESINSASLVKGGFPARYSGRLSSVLDVKFKNGDPQKHHKSLGVNTIGAKVHLNGPLNNKGTTYNISGKTSLLNLYLNKILTPNTRYSSIKLGYHDVMAKLNHQFSPSKQLSFSIFNVEDELSLTKNEAISSSQSITNIKDKNTLGWRSDVYSLKYNQIVGSRLIVKAQSGILFYDNGSISNYKFESKNTDTIKSDVLSVVTSSKIIDYNLRTEVEYYLNKQHTIKTGFNWINHKFNPGIKQSKFIIDNIPNELNDSDSVRIGDEYNIYIEDQFIWGNRLLIYAGLNLASYNLETKFRYNDVQPRLNVIWTPNKWHTFSLSYGKMAQFCHLLTNSGLGLPASLWVPSTEKIKPELASQISGKYELQLATGASMSIGAYNKDLKNIIEFTRPIELFYFLINSQSIVPIYNTSRDWERNVVSGTGRSHGYEMSFSFSKEHLDSWINVTWSKTTYRFPELNKGKPFPASHDRRWDINAGFSFDINNHWSTGLHFVYGSGRYFTLASEEYDSFIGIKLINVNERNNYKLPPFHQLTANCMYSGRSKGFDYRMALNVYNVYNRLNPYFVYIYRNTVANQDLGRKVSILPIVPTLSINIDF
jgi:hypothetical protein